MIQKGDDLINGGSSQNYLCHQNSPRSNFVGIVEQAMSYEDVLSQCESTLPSVETVLPHYTIPTPPPSCSSPSVLNMTNTNTNHMFQYNVYNESTNIQSTSVGCQLFNVDHNFSTYTVNKTDLSVENDSRQTQNANNSSQDGTSIYVSDGSTVDADDNDNLVDEPFTYLQNLNSDNLMKFSQQSELLKLMEEQMVETKANLNSIPVCEEHDNGGYDFRIQVNSTDSHAQRPGVLFSKETQRLYVKTNENVYIDCSYKVKMPIQPLNVRVFAVYSKDTSDPVLRCQNHISKDTEPDEIIRNSLVRCENPDSVYYGCDVGKSIRDRYSVLIPLNATVKANDSSNHLKQQLIINFTCNNSCMNRKQTSALFLLETMSGDILAQRELSVKISTCPKRDKRLYEGPTGSFNKRRTLMEPDFCPNEPKMAKYDESCVKDEFSRSSYDDPSDDDASGHVNVDYGGDNVDVHVEKDTGDFVLTLKYKTRQQMLQVLRVLYSNAITNEVFYKAAENGKKTRSSEYLRRGYEKALRLKGRHSHVDCQ